MKADQSAHIKIGRRVAALLNSPDSIAFDNTYITSAEYQLFIDDRLRFGEYRQPDHWPYPNIQTGKADLPILGVRGTDAIAFSEWLTIKTRSLILDYYRMGLLNSDRMPHFYFRLPTKAELDSETNSNELIGSWCKDNNMISLCGLTESQLKNLGEELRQFMHQEYDADLARDFDLMIYRDVDRNRNRDSGLERARNRDRNSLYQRRLRQRSPDISRFPAINIDNFRDSALELKRSLEQASSVDRELMLYIALAHDIDRAIREATSLEQIRAYLICVHIIWDILVNTLQHNSKGLTDTNTGEDRHSLILKKAQIKADESFHLYAYVVLVNLRTRDAMPAWESIRIVRATKY